VPVLSSASAQNSLLRLRSLATAHVPKLTPQPGTEDARLADLLGIRQPAAAQPARSFQSSFDRLLAGAAWRDLRSLSGCDVGYAG
jgi:hypothetical protein